VLVDILQGRKRQYGLFASRTTCDHRVDRLVMICQVHHIELCTTHATGLIARVLVLVRCRFNIVQIEVLAVGFLAVIQLDKDFGFNIAVTIVIVDIAYRVVKGFLLHYGRFDNHAKVNVHVDKRFCRLIMPCVWIFFLAIFKNLQTVLIAIIMTRFKYFAVLKIWVLQSKNQGLGLRL
jgi:hypothetical protein